MRRITGRNYLKRNNSVCKISRKYIPTASPHETVNKISVCVMDRISFCYLIITLVITNKYNKLAGLCTLRS